MIHPYLFYVRNGSPCDEGIITKSFSNAGTISLAENIKQRWLQYSFDGEIDEKSNELFFKKGGEFTAEDLESISNMNNELQASIRTLEQDILNLLIVLNRLE